MHASRDGGDGRLQLVILKPHVPRLELMRTVLRGLAAILFVVAGLLHFLKPELYLAIVPPYFPEPQALVVMSGVVEIAGGIGLCLRPLRRAAGWGLIALLIAVFPANLYMAQHPEQFHLAVGFLWARLPLQGVFIAWVWFAAIQDSHRIVAHAG